MSSASKVSPLGALGRGLLSGAAGTVAVTGYQVAVAKAMGSEPPALAGELGRRVASGILEREVEEEKTQTINWPVHLAYGTAWGGLYGLTQATFHVPTSVQGTLFGTLVGTVAGVQLPLLRLAPPPWQQPPTEVANTFAAHLVYGLTTALVFRVLHR